MSVDKILAILKMKNQTDNTSISIDSATEELSSGGNVL